MVLFFMSSQGYVIYMGRDKHENEDLIAYGITEDLWFHVENMSSAHVYLRLRKNQTLEDVPSDLVYECAALVKANSIEGCKKSEVWVNYTRWKNLKKTAGMEVGAVSFHRPANVKRIKVAKENSIVNALNKTKEERFPDLAELQRERLQEHIRDQKEENRKKAQLEKELLKEREAKQRQASYADVFDNLHYQVEDANTITVNGMTVDANAKMSVEEFEEDFM